MPTPRRGSPVDAVITVVWPASRNASIAGSAPRHLKAPSSRRSSRFSHTSRPWASEAGAGSSGVGVTVRQSRVAPMAMTASIQVRSPATGEELGEVPVTSPGEIDAAVRAARDAQPLLEEMTAHERAALLHRAADIVEERADDLARELALEQGKPLRNEAVEEIEETAGNLRMAAEDVKRMDTAVIPSERRGKVVFTFRKPNGVFTMITPWNFPMMIPSERSPPRLRPGTRSS